MKAIIFRYGAYGDIIHMSHLPHLLKDVGFNTVDVETNFKGYQLLAQNPYIDNIKGINPEVIFQKREWMLIKHWETIAEEYDKVINLINSLEYGLLAMEDENLYYMSNEVRRNRYQHINYYDQTTYLAGYPELAGKYNGEVYYNDKEKQIVKDWLKKFEGKFLIMINLAGTGPHKRFIQARQLINLILKHIDNSHIIVTAAPDYPNIEMEGVTSIIAKMPFRQALLITKYVNCVIGCESGLMIGASMWYTPTIMLMTAASIESHCKYNPNDYSIQSPAYCSPCYKGPYQYRGCPHKNGNPLCVYFNVVDIINKIKQIYERRLVTV